MTEPYTIEQLDRDLARLGPLVSFPWHTQQQFALASATNTVVVQGGNQSGKTSVAAGIISRLVRREGPIYRRLAPKRHREPLKIWVSPQTFEKYQSRWEPLLRETVFEGVRHSYVESPHPVFTWDDSCAKGNELWGKSQDQGFLAFESDVCDLIVFDEEPKDRRLYTSATQRLATTNGVIVFAFTPLLGLTWTHGSFYVPTHKDDFKVADRVWRRGNHLTLIQMGMADNPEAVAGGGVARIQNDPGMTAAEKRTRLYGEYGYAEGLIWPEFADLFTENESSPYLLDDLPKGRQYHWHLCCDPNKRHGGLLEAQDGFGNVYYVEEHYAESWPDSKHAAAYLDILARRKLKQDEVPFFADPGGAGAQSILNLAECGVFCQAVPKDAGSVSASIKAIRRLAYIDPTHAHPVTGKLGAPRCYFLRSLRSAWTADGVDYKESRLMWELRQYRQKETAPVDTPIKLHDDVVDPLRYGRLVRPIPPVEVDTSLDEARRKLDALSKREASEFDVLVARQQRFAANNTEGRNWP